VLKYIKTFESYSDISIEENENFYDIIGTNLYNLLNDQLEFLSSKYKGYINIKLLKKLIKNKDVKTSDIVAILEKDFKHRLNRLNAKNMNINDIYNELTSYLYFIHFIVIVLKIDVNKILQTNSKLIGITNKKSLYNIFNLKDISNLDDNIKKYVNILLKVESNFNSKKDISKTLNFIIEYFNTRYKIWMDFFSSDKYKEYQVENIKKAEVDDQQKESENAIQKIETAKTPTDITSKLKNNINTNTNTNIATKIATTVSTPIIIKSFKDKFAQKHGVGAGENEMKQWVLKMFAQAEKEYGKPFVITSGYRSKQYQDELRKNPRIKAAKHSPHVEGAAGDISLRGVNKRKLITALKNAGFNRFGVGKSFIHVDAADRINPNVWVPYARWSYKY